MKTNGTITKIRPISLIKSKSASSLFVEVIVPVLIKSFPHNNAKPEIADIRHRSISMNAMDSEEIK